MQFKISRVFSRSATFLRLFVYFVVVVFFFLFVALYFFSLKINRKFFHFLHLDRVCMFQLSRKSSDPSTLLILFQLLGETQSVRAHAGVVCSIIHHAAGKKKKPVKYMPFPTREGWILGSVPEIPNQNCGYPPSLGNEYFKTYRPS